MTAMARQSLKSANRVASVCPVPGDQSANTADATKASDGPLPMGTHRGLLAYALGAETSALPARIQKAVVATTKERTHTK